MMWNENQEYSLNYYQWKMSKISLFTFQCDVLILMLVKCFNGTLPNYILPKILNHKQLYIESFQKYSSSNEKQ